jgi:glycosyltransferase involved in cell wall biosynthesis
MRHGFPELGLKFESGDETCALTLNQAVPRIRQLSFLPVTWLMRGWADRADVARSALRQRPGQEKLLNWFFAKGLMQANLSAFLTQHQARSLLADSTDFPGTPRLLTCIWSTCPQLHDSFSGPQDPAFREWCATLGARDFPILAHPLIALARPAARRSHRLKPFGVNLFGHAHGRSGISEDVRMAAKALAEAGIPFAIHNVSPGAGMPDEEQATSSDERLPYAINLFAMTAAATVPAILEAGPADIRDCYNIGFWPWEMPEVPEFWQHAYDWVDEIWASSRFTYDAFCRSSPRPVRHMPFAVSADESDGLDRTHFDLPAETFLFGFAFDGLSSFARKAPLSTLRAFQEAFPLGNSSVGLVLKGLRVSEDAQWKQILDAVAGDDRIHLITSSLPRGSLLDLWRALDCFVSLHRSEGFGRNIAETMLLGKPAIATAHSGNMDFTRSDTAALVACKLRPAEPGEYPYCTGQIWAEPDIKAAAAQMRRVAADATWRENLSTAGRQEIAERYSFKAVGTAWSRAMQAIYKTA